MFGQKWLSEYDFPRLVTSGCYNHPDYGCVPTQISLTYPDGAKYTYRRTADTMYRVSNASAAGKFIYYPAGYFPDSGYFLYLDGVTIQFSTGRYIQKILTSGGKVWREYVYGANAWEPIAVKNAAGQSVGFTWSGGKVVNVTDPAKRVWTYAYNANGMLQSVTSPGTDADVRTYHYEDPNDKTLLTGITINGVRHSTYSYFVNKKVKESGLAGAEDKETFTYGTNTTTVTSALGQVTTYTYTAVQGGLKLSNQSRSATSSCPAAAAEFVYDANGWVDYTLDWRGNKTDYSYDSAGKLLLAVRASGTTSASGTAYTWSGEKVSTVERRNANGVALSRDTYTYYTTGFAKDMVQSVVSLDLKTNRQRKTSYVYAFHANGVMSSKQASWTIRGGEASATWSYDTSGNLVSHVNALGQGQSWAGHNGLGQPGSHTSINGVVTSFVYDVKGNPRTSSTMLENGSRLTTYTFSHDHQLTDAVYADGSAARYRYGADGRLAQVGDAASNLATRAWDGDTNTETWSFPRQTPVQSGGVPVAVNAGNFVSTTTLDSLGRPWVIRGNNGQRLTFARDGNGNVTSRTDVSNRVTLYEYDPLDRLDKVTLPDTGVVDYTYDVEGRLSSVKDPRGLITSFTYDGWGRVLARSSPDTGTTTFTYDDAGLLYTEERAGGQLITYNYDALGRLTSRSTSGLTETYRYDEGLYGKGHLTSFSDASGSTNLGYDAAGQLVSQVTVVDGVRYTTIWHYDTEGRLTQLDYPTGAEPQLRLRRQRQRRRRDAQRRQPGLRLRRPGAHDRAVGEQREGGRLRHQRAEPAGSEVEQHGGHDAFRADDAGPTAGGVRNQGHKLCVVRRRATGHRARQRLPHGAQRPPGPPGEAHQRIQGHRLARQERRLRPQRGDRHHRRPQPRFSGAVLRLGERAVEQLASGLRCASGAVSPIRSHRAPRRDQYLRLRGGESDKTDGPHGVGAVRH
jgi:YD repeat-containing protein